MNKGKFKTKYPTKINGKIVKEYDAWKSMMRRCFDEKIKEKYPTYKNATCCDEWLLYDNFYEWIHSQENFDKWHSGNKWAVDKDILVKGNKVYNQNTCCLVPMNINNLFKQSSKIRKLPIGISYKNNKYYASCNNPITNKRKSLGYFDTLNEAFFAYKEYKENIIKQIAQKEYNSNNITKECYDAMIGYKVEITD